MPIFDQKWFADISRPSRYLGNEINQIKKDRRQVEVSIALAFPDLYEVGMSHLGLKILYHLLNTPEWLAAERVFCPWNDLEQQLRLRQIPLTTMESGYPLSDFDLIGFSLQHELCYSNVLTMLDLGHIPFLSKDRNDSYPLIIAGGPACFNPEPMADFFDVMVIGDGEEAALVLCEGYREIIKRRGFKKEELLRYLCSLKGFYIPRYFAIHYYPSGEIRQIESLLGDYREVKKTVISDLDQHDFPVSQIVPFTELIHDRLAIEVTRGCTRGCRFCQAGMIYRPVRERNPNTIIQKAFEGIQKTGYDEFSLLSLSSGDYSCIGPLIRSLMDEMAKQHVAVSLPSLRMDNLDPSWFEQIKRVRKTGFTLAPEAGNDSLRKVINKNLTNTEIMKTAQEVYKAGWLLMKLYFMIGLPTESDQDLVDLSELAKEIIMLAEHKKKRSSLHISVSTFVPKSHTPFMWEQQISPDESWRRIQCIQKRLEKTAISIKWNDPAMSWLEGVFSRGDRRLRDVLLFAWEKGARFDAWREQYRAGVWQESFRLTKIDPDFYIRRQRSPDEIMPWNHIQSGIQRDFFIGERKKAFDRISTSDCRLQCHQCGVCDFKEIMPKIADQKSPLSTTPETHLKETVEIVPKRYRMILSKTGYLKYISHLELNRLLMRAFKRAGLRLSFSQGYHPLPKISFYSALPVGVESIHETIDIQWVDTDGITISCFMEKVNQRFPEGLQLLKVEELHGPKKAYRLKETEYQIDLHDILPDPVLLERFLSAAEFPLKKFGKQGPQLIDARPMVKTMYFSAPNRLTLCMHHTTKTELKPTEIVAGIFDLEESSKNHLNVLKTKQIIE